MKAHKDPLQPKKNVVYQLNCKDCNASYVRQTSRVLKIKINKHCIHINRNMINHSVITDHTVHYNHDFDDWEEVEILDVERNYNKRIVSEVHIVQTS